MGAKVDVVIVNWNSGAQLRTCLDSLARAMHAPDIEVTSVIVVDNASTDDSCDGLDNMGLPLQILRNKANYGFAAACNQGARECRADYLLFLNPDTRVEENSLAGPLSFLESTEGQAYCIAGIQGVGDDGKVQRTCARFPTPATLLGNALGIDRLIPRLVPSHFLSDEEHRHDRDVDQVIGAFFMIRRRAFVELGGFDERFFVYYEELDLSRRASERGWKTRYLTSVRFFHQGGGTSQQIKARRLFYVSRSRLQYAYKHFGRWRGTVLLLAALVLEPPVRCAYALAKLDFLRIRETLDGYRMLLCAAPGILRAGFRR